MNDTEPLHLGAPALKHCLPLSLFFHIWNFRNLQQLRFLVIENHLEILEKITHNFPEKQSYTQSKDWRFF